MATPVTAGVEVSTERVVRAWHKAESTDLWLQYRSATRRPGQLDAVTAALWAANWIFDEADETGYSASADGPWEDPLSGAAYQILLNRCGSEEALRAWLAAFARAMTETGSAGSLKPLRERHYPSWAILDTIPWPQMTAFIAYDMLGPPGEPARWNVAPDATARIAALDHRNAFPGAESYINSLRAVRASPRTVVAALEQSLLRHPIVATTHLRRDPPRFAHSAFDSNGQTMRVVYNPSLSWRERLADTVAFMTALPDITTVAFVQYASGISNGLTVLERGGPPLPEGSHEYHFRGKPQLLLDGVPDARGAVVLSDAHLDRAHDLSGWSITPLGSGRHLVQAADLAAWFAQPEVDSEVLAAARADFGEMIVRI